MQEGEEDHRLSIQDEEEELEHSYIEFSYIVCKKLRATGCRKKKKKILDAVCRRRRRRSWSTVTWNFRTLFARSSQQQDARRRRRSSMQYGGGGAGAHVISALVAS
jgi:hypothetical protein